MNEVTQTCDIGEPTIKPLYFECEFTVSSREGLGGDWERNIGGSTREQRINFKGYASNDLLNALEEAIDKVLS